MLTYTYETGFAQCLFKLILGGRFVFFLEHGFQDYDVAFVLALEICVLIYFHGKKR